VPGINLTDFFVSRLRQFDHITQLMPLLEWKAKAELVIETRAVCGEHGFTLAREMWHIFRHCKPRHANGAKSQRPKSDKSLDTRWLHVIKPAKNARGRGAASHSWSGRMQHLREGVQKDFQDEVHKLASSMQKDFQRKTDENVVGENRKLEARLDRMSEHLETQQQKMDRFMEEMRVKLETPAEREEREERERKARAGAKARSQGQSAVGPGGGGGSGGGGGRESYPSGLIFS
jgi:uncharacterized membrane protein YgcG